MARVSSVPHCDTKSLVGSFECTGSRLWRARVGTQSVCRSPAIQHDQYTLATFKGIPHISIPDLFGDCGWIHCLETIELSLCAFTARKHGMQYYYIGCLYQVHIGFVQRQMHVHVTERRKHELRVHGWCVPFCMYNEWCVNYFEQKKSVFINECQEHT